MKCITEFMNYIAQKPFQITENLKEGYIGTRKILENIRLGKN